MERILRNVYPHDGRTPDAIQLTEFGEHDTVMLIAAEAIEVRLPTVEWTTGYAGPVRTSRLWKRVTRQHIDSKWLGASWIRRTVAVATSMWLAVQWPADPNVLTAR